MSLEGFWGEPIGHVWADFDYVDTAAEMDARRSRTNPVSELLFYSKMSSLRWPHIHDEFTPEMRADVEELRMETVLLQPEPPQCDTSPQRLPAVGTGWRNPERRDGCPRSVRGQMNPEYRELSQRKGKKLFFFKPVWVFFLRFNCTSP